MTIYIVVEVKRARIVDPRMIEVSCILPLVVVKLK